MQVSAEYENRKECPSKYDTCVTRIFKGAQKCSDPRSKNKGTALSSKNWSATARARACGIRYLVGTAALDHARKSVRCPEVRRVNTRHLKFASLATMIQFSRERNVLCK